MKNILFVLAMLSTSKAFSQAGTSYVADVRFSTCTYGAAAISTHTSTNVLTSAPNGKMSDATYVEIYNSSATVAVGFDVGVVTGPVTSAHMGREILAGNSNGNPAIFRILPGKINIYATSEDPGLVASTPVTVIQCK